MSENIKDLAGRLERLEDVLASAAALDLTVRVHTEYDDDLASSEKAIDNLLEVLDAKLRSRTQAEEGRERLIHDAEERLKELQGLYAVSKAVAVSTSLEDLCKRVSALIPRAWHYPEITRARVVLDGQEHVAEPFDPTCWKQTVEIVVAGKPRGAIEVYYLEERPELDEGPFLAEERHLIDGIASTLGVAIERKRAEERLRSSERELRIGNQIANIFLTFPDDQMYVEVLDVVLEAVESEYGVFGYIDEKGAFVVPSMTRHIWDKCLVPDKRFIFPRETWGDSTWPRAIREKRTIYSNEPSTITLQGHVAISRHVSLPVVHQGEVVGLFQVANKKTEYVTDDITQLEVIGSLVALVLSARLERDREEQARKRAEERLREALAEAERLNRLTMGREMRVVEMKKEVNALLAELGRPARYESVAEGAGR